MLRVTVRRVDGAAAAGARVLVVSPDRVVAEARTDEAGTATFTASDEAVAVVATLPGARRARPSSICGSVDTRSRLRLDSPNAVLPGARNPTLTTGVPCAG